jgi:hypothetical protein
MRQTWKCRDYSNISEQLKITVESNGDGVASSRRRVYSRISTAFPGFSPRLFTAPNLNLNSHQTPRFDRKFCKIVRFLVATILEMGWIQGRSVLGENQSIVFHRCSMGHKSGDHTGRSSTVTSFCVVFNSCRVRSRIIHI